MGTTYLLSPSEGKLKEKLVDRAIFSDIPEKVGADIVIYTSNGTIGIQRKEVPHDFIASVEDGRLARGTSLLGKAVKFPILLCEGRFRYMPDGHLIIRPRMPSRYTRGSIKSLLMDVKYIKLVDYDFTEDLDDTVHYLKTITAFVEADKHLGLYSRPNAQGTWLVPTAKDIELWIMQGFDGIGPATAEKIIKKFGRIPFEWTCTLDELKSVDGLTVKKAEYLHGFFKKRGQRIDDVPAPTVDNIDDMLAKLGKMSK